MTRPLSRDPDQLGSLLIEALTQAAPAIELDPELRQAMRRRILARLFEAAPARTETIRGESLPWEQPWPGVWAKVLKRNLVENLQITLFRMEPDSRVPAHEHTKVEECVVLEGELLIGSHRLVQGDLHTADACSHHPDITTRSGALLLVRSEIPRGG